MDNVEARRDMRERARRTTLEAVRQLGKKIQEEDLVERRQTGRTSSMLSAAEGLASGGYRVLVVCDNREQEKRLFRMTRGVFGYRGKLDIIPLNRGLLIGQDWDFAFYDNDLRALHLENFTDFDDVLRSRVKNVIEIY